MTLKKYEINMNENKTKNTQSEQVVPSKLPVRVTIDADTGKIKRELIAERKPMEETKKYFAPEHYPKKTNEFGFLNEFGEKVDNWLSKSKKNKKKIKGGKF